MDYGETLEQMRADLVPYYGMTPDTISVLRSLPIAPAQQRALLNAPYFLKYGLYLSFLEWFEMYHTEIRSVLDREERLDELDKHRLRSLDIVERVIGYLNQLVQGQLTLNEVFAAERLARKLEGIDAECLP